MYALNAPHRSHSTSTRQAPDRARLCLGLQRVGGTTAPSSGCTSASRTRHRGRSLSAFDQEYVSGCIPEHWRRRGEALTARCFVGFVLMKLKVEKIERERVCMSAAHSASLVNHRLCSDGRADPAIELRHSSLLRPATSFPRLRRSCFARTTTRSCGSGVRLRSFPLRKTRAGRRWPFGWGEGDQVWRGLPWLLPRLR
jgi:hypothetical protein